MIDDKNLLLDESDIIKYYEKTGVSALTGLKHGMGYPLLRLNQPLRPNKINGAIRMNGMEAIREIRRLSPETKIVVLTVHKTEEYILATFKAGADGYVLKDATHEELMTALNHVLTGKRYISPGISEKVIEGYLDGRKTIKSQTSWETLTHRERRSSS